MSKRIQQRATINGITKWLSGTTQQEIFDAYLRFAIDMGAVLPAGEAAQKKNSPVIFETRAWKWFQLYKVGKVRLTTLANYETYLKKHLLPHFGERDIRSITIDDVQEFLNLKSDYAKKTVEELWITLSMILEAAREDGLIPLNPAKSKRLKNPSRKNLEQGI